MLSSRGSAGEQPRAEHSLGEGLRSARLAQLAERVPCKNDGLGSNPRAGSQPRRGNPPQRRHTPRLASRACPRPVRRHRGGDIHGRRRRRRPIPSAPASRRGPARRTRRSGGDDRSRRRTIASLWLEIAYVAALNSDAIAVFTRDTGTGALTQKPDPGGCISEDGSGGCTDAKAIHFIGGVKVSPDGENVYAFSRTDYTVAAFDRAANGTLTQKAGAAACISQTGSSGACVDGIGLANPVSLLVSPDGKNVYVPSQNSRGIAILDRDPATGALTQKAGAAGCITEETRDGPAGVLGTCGYGRFLSSLDAEPPSPPTARPSISPASRPVGSLSWTGTRRPVR